MAEHQKPASNKKKKEKKICKWDEMEETSKSRIAKEKFVLIKINLNEVIPQGEVFGFYFAEILKYISFVLKERKS